MAAIDPKLQSYVNAFLQEAKVRNVQVDISNLSVIFADGLTDDWGNDAVGLTELFDEGSIIVSISRQYYNEVKKTQGKIKALMFHELGHALLCREHSESRSLMNDVKDFNLTQSKKSNRLIDELFDHTQFNTWKS